MDTTLDPSIRLAALQQAMEVDLKGGRTAAGIVSQAKEFYAFLTGVGYVSVTLKPERPASEPTLPSFPPELFSGLAPTVATVDPLPLEGHDLIPTAEAVEATKRKRRTKTEMEAARAAEDEAKDLEAAATRAKVRAEIAKLDAVEALKDATQSTPAPVAASLEVADVKAALMKVVEKDGLGPTAGGKLLAQFGVKRVSELEEKQFADFIAACNAAVAA